ncbi:MAG: nitrate/nitrite transporter NrtS [Leptolyngbyaceae cyanobacterium]
MKGYISALTDRDLRTEAAKVALVVGTILFSINHGPALANGKMTPSRWLAGLLTYCIPYSVNIHGQYSYRRKQSAKKRAVPEQLEILSGSSKSHPERALHTTSC